MARLGVNIDHVATLRQARGEFYPSLVDAAQVVLKAGADQITIHLREDRRHIQDTDVPAIKMMTEKFDRPLNLELGVADEILDIASNIKPEWICIVPEKREEKTTEGGLDLINKENFLKVSEAMKRLRLESPHSKISLFVEAQENILLKCIDLKADAVEIHTGDYAIAFNGENSIDTYLETFIKFKDLMESHHISYHAGHGLTLESLRPLVDQRIFQEYNIGHWVICDALFNGLEKTTRQLLEICKS